MVGGVAQGIGQVLYEEARYDQGGQPLVGTLADAGLADGVSMPKVTVILAEAGPGPLAEARVRGVAEAPTVGLPPALVRALESNLGRRLRRTPLEPSELRRVSQ